MGSCGAGENRPGKLSIAMRIPVPVAEILLAQEREARGGLGREGKGCRGQAAGQGWCGVGLDVALDGAKHV